MRLCVALTCFAVLCCSLAGAAQPTANFDAAAAKLQATQTEAPSTGISEQYEFTPKMSLTNRLDKVPYSVTPPPANGLRQGGDTCADATVIPGLPYSDAGTTDGYVDDYDEVCPYTGSTSPDVTYSFTPTMDMEITVNICESAYDTKVYMYEGDCPGTLVACNDDACSNSAGDPYRSLLDCVPVVADVTYYIVVDGYGGDFGEYTIEVDECLPCVVECDPDATIEDEPICSDEYVDISNGGCNSDPAVFQPIACGETICGTSGTFLFEGGNYRDTDWFEITTTEQSILTWSVIADFDLLIFIIDGNGGCDASTILVSGTGLPCQEVTLVSECLGAGTYWVWVGPSVFDGIPCGATWQGTLTCEPCTIPTGACCLPDATCEVLTEAVCASSNGIYFGDGVLCEDIICPTGACCLPDGSCADGLTPQECAAQDGTYQGDGVLCSEVECPQPGINDLCADAILVEVPSVTTGTTLNATVDSEFPLCGTSISAPGVWYKVIGTGNTMTATTCGDFFDYDTKLSVYCAGCDDPVCVGGNDDNCSDGASGLLSTVTWCSTAGEEYLILVHGFSSASGAFELQVFDDGTPCDGAIPCEPCVIVCDPNEGEPLCSDEYVDTYNGGCNSDPAVFQSIACGDMICGESGTYLFGGSSYRDTDWFEITITEQTEFTWTVTAEFDVLIFIIQAPCPGTILESATGVPCQPTSITRCLDAGTYYLWVGPSVFSGVPCGSLYEAELICAPCFIPTGACCLYGGDCIDDVTEEACVNQGGSYAGDDTTCADVECCDIVCDPGEILEGEPLCSDEYVDTWNGGCNSDPAVFKEILCGDTICGESGTYLFGGSSYRDTDWFNFTLDGQATVNWTVEADFPVLIFIIQAPCPGTIITSATADPCVPATVTADLGAGEYYVWVGPSVFAGVPCGVNWRGTLDCLVYGACCIGTDCFVLTEDECLAQDGEYLGDYTDCGGGEYVVESCENEFEDITSTGTPLTLSDDDFEEVSIGFTFTFWGVNHDVIKVGSNGYLTFGPDGTDYSNDPIPNANDPNDFIAPFWDDLNPSLGEGQVHYETLGTEPNRRFIAQWTHVAQYGGTDSNTFQAVLYEADNCIEFRYGDFTPEATPGDYTIGVENPDGTAGVQVDAATVLPGDCIRICFEAGENPCEDPCQGQLLGDANCDGLVNNFDIDAFVLALTGGQAAWEAEYGGLGCDYLCVNDINGDGLVNNFDIDPFVAILTGK